MSATSTIASSSAATRASESEPGVAQDLYRAFAVERRRLTDVTWEQHRYHEHRRWSAVEKIAAVDFAKVSEADRVLVWNAGRAELTTKPGADRLARLSDTECRAWEKKDDALAAVFQACGTWSRYWNEEEAYHETTFNTLSRMLGLEPIENDTFLEFRKIFPDDDALRTLVLLAISEITASVNYATCAKQVADPGLKAIFKQVGADEVQHMNYFLSFAKALVDSGKYHPKGAFAVAHFFLRDDGDLHGSTRASVVKRDTHVNWWDHLDARDAEVTPAMSLERKQTLIFHALKRVTGIEVSSVDEVEDKWMELVGC
jgi:hypothetical protein